MLKNNMKIIKDVLVVIAILLLTYFTAEFFGMLYEQFFPGSIGDGGIFLIGKDAGYSLAGLVPAYLFFTLLLLTIFAGKEKYWITGVMCALAVVAVVYLGLLEVMNLYFPITLAILGWLIGFGIQNLISRFKKPATI